MKRLLFTLAITLLLSASVYADTDIADKIFTRDTCTFDFRQGPTGPGENGDVYVSCDGNKTIVTFNWEYTPPFVLVYVDGKPCYMVYRDDQLTYLDPYGFVLTGN